MGFCVFVHRTDSIYEDSPAEQYQFPRQYLQRAQACIGDWVLYYAPRKASGARGYYAIAKVHQIIPDPAIAGMYVALIEPGSYVQFASPVPFADAAGPIERGLLNNEGRISGRAQAAIRPISPADFQRILALGLDETPLLPRLGDEPALSLNEDPAPFRFEQERDRVNLTVSRIVRDRVFRSVVLRAYDQRCAMTGLRLINGGGRAEVAAAHIRPVEASGPDIVNNGIALCGTAHWMFDRGLISLADDLEILVSRQVNDVAAVRGLINASGRAAEPLRAADRPHPHFLEWHRQNCFKQ